MPDLLKPLLLNHYLAHRQHLLPGSRGDDVVQVTRDIVALHATAPTSPFFSLWARVNDFQREMLDEALYERCALAKWLCMRVTLHAVPSDEVAYFHQAFPAGYLERSTPAQFQGGGLLAEAGLCMETEAQALLDDLHRRVLEFVAQKGPSTVRQMGNAIPELRAKIRHDVGKAYEGEFSIGSRLVGGMCTRGMLVRARVQGTWRSNLYEYALPSEWLPGVDLDSVAQGEARAWLVRRYLAAFGPATLDDVAWWMGLAKGEVRRALESIAAAVIEIAVEGWGDEYLMLADDAERLRDFVPPKTPYVFLLPSLDPLVMGYRDRERFLAEEHRAKVFDRAGNAVPTVWVDGRAVGVWGQRKDGQVFFELFEPGGGAEQDLILEEVRRLEGFLDGETLPPGVRTPFTRKL